MFQLKYLNRAAFGLLAFLSGAVCAYLGGGLTSSIEASTEAKFESSSDGIPEVLMIDQSPDVLSLTVEDPQRMFLVLGVDADPENTLEGPGENPDLLQTYLPGSNIKIRGDRSSRIYELVAVADCPAGGVCLPCQWTTCTGPMPPPGGPEPPWIQGFWLNDQVVRP